MIAERPLKFPRNHPEAAEEAALVRAAQAGDLAARNELITRHIGMIRWHTARCIRRGAWVEEYLAVAVEAVIKAIGTFDPARGTRLMSYAQMGIWQALRRVQDEDSVIRVPCSNCAAAETPRKAEARARARAMRSLDAPVGRSERRPSSLGELVAARDPEPLDGLEDLAAAFSVLTVTEERVIRGRLAGLPLRIVGEDLGGRRVTREGVRVIEMRAIKRMRKFFQEQAMAKAMRAVRGGDGAPTTPRVLGERPVAGAAAGYEVRAVPAPAAREGRQDRHAVVIIAARDLKPGQWFTWTDAPRSLHRKRLSETFTRACGFPVKVYRSEAGNAIVSRPA